MLEAVIVAAWNSCDRKNLSCDDVIPRLSRGGKNSKAALLVPAGRLIGRRHRGTCKLAVRLVLRTTGSSSSDNFGAIPEKSESRQDAVCLDWSGRDHTVCAVGVSSDQTKFDCKCHRRTCYRPGNGSKPISARVSAVVFTNGKGRSGSSRARAVQIGPQPSSGLHSTSRSGGAVDRM